LADLEEAADMTTNPSEPDWATWRQLFAALSGDATVDAAIVREFCDTHGVSAARVMAELQAHRRTAGPGHNGSGTGSSEG
jgi:hypothetical protein